MSSLCYTSYLSAMSVPRRRLVVLTFALVLIGKLIKGEPSRKLLYQDLSLFNCHSFAVIGLVFYYGLDESQPPKSSFEKPWDKPCTDECVRYHKRLEKYCHLSLLNLNSSLKNAHEGILSPTTTGFELAHVHIITRHGDRSPANVANMGSAVFYQCGLVDDQINWNGLRDFPQPSPIAPNTKILQSHLKLHPGSKKRKCGVGGLTNVGFMQHYVLGQLMSFRYIDLIERNKLSTVDAISELYVQSTDYTRTIHSAAAFLLGFLPDLSPVRKATVIHVSPGRAGFLESPPHGVSTTYTPCKNVFEFRAQERQKTGYLATERKIYHPLLEKLCDMFYIHNKNLPIITKVFDHVLTRGCHDHGRPLPCNSKECVSYEFGNELFAFADWTWNNKYPLNSSIVAMMPFLKHSVLQIMDSIAYKSHHFKPKLMLSFAHDSTILQTLNALRLPTSNEWMPYASRLVFEMWKKKDSLNYYVRILYNGQPITNTGDGVHVQHEFVEFSKWRDSLTTGNYRSINSYNSVCGNA